ncbi:MAG: nucleotidyltransferase family protein [Bacteroidales bacterium]|jgi:NDP-sugar pyrophosphorylase family protein|nr:nucleotidyltransferase family protein [Bacteroidales bacterium]
MKAMIFAAGHGTRLKPLTDSKPKALVEVNKTTLLEHTINKLIANGVTEIIINVHAFADQIIAFLDSKNRFNIRIEISDERDLLLETGGGLKKAAWFFNDSKPFIVHNVDILSDIDLNEMIQQHIASGCLATLAMEKRDTSRYFLLNQNLELCGWENSKTKVKIISKSGKISHKLAFSGIHVIDPAIFDYFENDNLFSITSKYLELSKKHKIMAYQPKNTYWFDVGKPDDLRKAEKYYSLI